jgi:LmbE family N-acetylglucosaminyl deacetylase
MRHVFISPHLDDAVFSASNYITKLKHNKNNTLVITVFTNFGQPPLNSDATKFIKDCHFNSLNQFQTKRLAEDRQAMKLLSTSYLHLGFTDALFRHKNLKSVFSGKIPFSDKILSIRIYKKLKKLIKANDLLYAPLGIGNHLDHLITHNLVKRFKNQTRFWTDQPYISKPANKKALKQLLPKLSLSFSVANHPQKLKAMKCYPSQLNYFFPNKIRLVKESFYSYL